MFNQEEEEVLKGPRSLCIKYMQYNYKLEYEN